MGFCGGTSLAQADPTAGAFNPITVTLRLQSPLMPQSRISLTGLLPSFTPVLFAVTTSQQCAEALPYGPTDKLLPVPGEGGEGNPMLADAEPGYDPSYLRAVDKTGFGSASGFASTFNGNSMHHGFLQRLYDNDVLKFEILWSFLSGPKTLKQRFMEAAGDDPRTEPVVWTIRDEFKREVAVKRGVWSFSGKFDTLTNRFDAEDDNTAESSPESKGFSPDDGVWGAATGYGTECCSGDACNVAGALKCGPVDGAISPHENNPIIQRGGDFWGHGNFNQLNDHGCEPNSDGIKPCCETYFMGGIDTAVVSQNIRNEMFFIPCPACHCNDVVEVSTDGTLTGTGPPGDPSLADNTCAFFQRKTDDPPLPVLLQSCGVIPPAEGWWDNPQPFYVSFGDSINNPAPGHSDWTVVVRVSDQLPAGSDLEYTFNIRNPQQVPADLDPSTATSAIIADTPAGQSLEGMPYVKSFPYEQSAAYTVPPGMKLSGMPNEPCIISKRALHYTKVVYTILTRLHLPVVRQSNPKPGELNNVTMLFRPSSEVIPNSRIIIDDLLDPAVLFARMTESACAGDTGSGSGLPFLPGPIPTNRDQAWVSGADGNRLHTSWTQEIHADGKLKFSIAWLFSKTRSLDERISVMASEGGEGVTWYIFSPDGRLLTTKHGTWRTPRKALWPAGNWALDALWGAASGPLGSQEGSVDGSYTLPADFWGHGWLVADPNVWCERYWMEGTPYKASDIRNEIRLETTPLVSVAVGRFTPHRMVDGRVVFVLQGRMYPKDATELSITVVNGLEPRNYSQPRLSVQASALDACFRIA
jgi:hypothetical protein